MSRGSRIAAIVVLGSLVFAACGGNSDTGNTSDSGSTATEAPSGSASASESTGSSSGTGTVMDVSDCTAVGAAFAAAMGSAAVAMSGDTSATQDALHQLDAYASQVPEEIQGDLNTVIEGVQAFEQAIADVGYDPSSGQPPTAEQLAALQAASAAFGDPAFTTASDNVSAWITNECGQ